jgi:galactose mutarotase-like enzyme
MKINTIRNQSISISVAANGAELRSLRRNADMHEWMWQANAEYWPRTAPVLFPIVGKLNENIYRHGSNLFPMGQHGFARDMEFTLAYSGDDFLVYRLDSNEQTFRVYPFHFSLEIEYRLIDSSLAVLYRVFNQGEEDMYFSIGAHPGFSLDGWPAKKYFLEFDKDGNLTTMALQDGLIATGEGMNLEFKNRRIEITKELFFNDALVLKDFHSKWIGIFQQDSTQGIRVNFSGFPFLGIWSKPGAPFVCIEPWYGHADPLGFEADIAAKPGIVKLQEGASFSCDYSIEVLN